MNWEIVLIRITINRIKKRIIIFLIYIKYTKIIKKQIATKILRVTETVIDRVINPMPIIEITYIIFHQIPSLRRLIISSLIIILISLLIIINNK